MTIKLKNQQQVEGLELILRVMLTDYEPKNIAESLVFDLVVKGYRKIRTRAEHVTRQGYSFSLTTEEAKALYLFYQNQVVPSALYVYEAHILMAVITQIGNDYLSRNQSTNIRTGALAPGSSAGLRSIQA